MMQLYFLLIALLIALVAKAAITVEENVLVLDDSNFQEALAENSQMLVEFYAPWCGHCKQLAPEWAKAAKTLADSPIKLAKVDATIATGLAQEFEIKGFPTIKFFRNGKALEYSGGRSEEEIVNWVNKKTGPSAAVIASADDLTNLEEIHDVFIVGTFASETSENYKQFLTIADELEDYKFVVSFDAAVISVLGVSGDTITVIKSFDNKRADLKVDTFDATAVTNFILGESIPLISTFTQETAKDIFKSPIKKHVLFFTNAASEYHASVLNVLTEAAKKWKGQLLFVNVPHDETKVVEFFDLKETDMPKVIIGDMGHESGLKKYKFDGTIDEASIDAFFASYVAGQIKPSLKSEAVTPEDTANPVVVLKGTSFHDIVINNDKDVLVEFYAPWCGHCKKLAPIWDELAEKFKTNDNIVIAKIDSTANEVDIPGVAVKGFPSIYFFKGNDKFNPVKYDDGRELDAFVSFLSANTHHKFKHDEL